MTDPRYGVYKRVERSTSSNRQTEARVLTTAALKLKTCQDNWEAVDVESHLDEALHYNQKIWTILQCAVIDPDCPLPDDLRLNMLKISAFIDKQIFQAMAHPSPEALTPIIDINLGLAQGLLSNPPKQSSNNFKKMNLKKVVE